MPGRRWAHDGKVAVVVGLALSGYYLLTMDQGLGLYDSAELALVAHTLGVGHPPGQPLFTLVGFLFSHLPGLSPQVGLSALSALSGGTCGYFAYRIARRTAGPRITPRASVHGASALFFAGLHALLWEPSTRIEVYALATALALWGIDQAQLRFDTPTGPSAGNTTGEAVFKTVFRTTRWPALLLGLSASVHPVVAAIGALAVAPTYLRWAGALWPMKGLRRFALADASTLFWGAVGLLPFAYLFWSAQGAPSRFVWGDWQSADGIAHYFSAKDYTHNQAITLPLFGSHLQAMTGYLVAHSAVVFFVSALLPLHRSLPRRSTVMGPIALVLGLCAVSANVVFAPGVLDYHGYLLLGFWLCAAGLASFVMRAGSAAHSEGQSPAARRLGLLALICTALMLVAALLAPPSPLARQRDRLSETLARAVLETAPPDALLLVESDHWVAPLLFLQEVANLRPDVAVMPIGLSSSSWYFAYLFERHPDLADLALKGPGGRDGRLQRLVQGHRARPVLTETVTQALRVGLRPCHAAILVSTAHGEGSCEVDVVTPPIDQVRAVVSAVGDQSPGLEGFAAAVGLSWGENLWRLGRPAEALSALLASVIGTEEMPQPDTKAALQRVPALTGSLPNWQRQVPLGDPARNLFVAARLAALAQQPRLFEALLLRAAEAGLPEAIALLENATPAGIPSP